MYDNFQRYTIEFTAMDDLMDLFSCFTGTFFLCKKLEMTIIDIFYENKVLYDLWRQWKVSLEVTNLQRTGFITTSGSSRLYGAEFQLID